MPIRYVRGDLTPLLDLQEGLVRRDQVVGVCVTDAVLRWLLERRRWRAVLPSVYLATGADLTARQRLVAASLYAGETSQITGPAALRVHGLRYAPADPRVHVLIPEPRHLRSAAFVVVQRTHRFDPKPREDGRVQIVSVGRAVADTARHGHDLRTVRAFVTEAVQQRLTTPQLLAEELEDGPRRGSGILREVIGDVRQGVRSAPEAELKDVVDTIATIPRVLWNPQLRTIDGERLPTPDGWIDDADIAIEVDSREHHATPDGWARTLRRHNELASRGILVLHFTPEEIRTQPELVRRRLVDAYRTRRASSRDQSVVHVVRAT